MREGRRPAGDGRERPAGGARGALLDGDLAQKDVVVTPSLEALEPVADRVDGYAVVWPELDVLVPDDPLELLVLGLAGLRVGDAALGHELLHLGIVEARELLRTRLREPLAEVPVGVVGHVGPAGEEHVVVTGGPELPGGGDLEVLDVELDT